MDRLFRRCPCVKPPEIEVRVLDYCHCSLEYLPAEVFNFERTLEELNVAANRIRDLPRELFYCHGLRKLNLCDNELTAIPPAISSLVNLEELDISKNGIVDLPEDVKCCKYLSSVEASVNPLGKLPDGFTQLLNLTELYLNDTFLDYLPGSFGRLTKLKILEVRENHLNTLPKSMSRLLLLERLDIGNNQFTELPDIVGSFPSLTELWCDQNQIANVPKVVGGLKQLMFLDASKNRIEWLPEEIEGCLSLADLHLSTNLLQQLPDSIGRLSNLTTLKVDDNRLTSLPFTIGGLVSLSELNVSANDLEELPPSIGFLRHLRTLYADENFLYDVPPEVGSCSGITVLSLRSNNLMYVPDEMGRIAHLRVLNLSDNKIKFLPYSLMRLKELQALWLAENQTTPLIRLQPDIDIDSGQRMLTCYLLPQQQTDDREDLYSDADSFHPSLWEEERQQRQRIHFENVQEEEGNLQRTPTPYPKEMKHRIQHMRNLALKQVGQPNGSLGTSVAQTPPVERSGQPTSPALSQGMEGTRTDDQVSVIKKPTSPLLQERHHLLKADKEKNLKDKAKMQHLHSKSSESSPSKDKGSEVNEKVKMSTSSKGKENFSKIKSQSKPGKVEDDDGGFLTGSGRRGTDSRYSVDHGTSTCSSRGSSANIPQNIPSSVGSSSASQRGTGHNPAVSYADFTRGLHDKNSAFRSVNSTGQMASGYSSHLQAIPQTNNRRPPGRRLGGYESDTGYRSDFEMYRRGWQQPLPRGRDGYSSDWEVTHKHRTRDGYSSDAEAGRARYHLFRPMPVQPAPVGTNNRGSWGSRQSVNCAPTIKPASCTNVPFSSRTTIRNDEMYEQNQSNSRAQRTATGSSRSLHLQTVREIHSNPGKPHDLQASVETTRKKERKLSNASQNSASTDSSMRHRHSGSSHYSVVVQPKHTPGLNSSHSNRSLNHSVERSKYSAAAQARESPNDAVKANSTDDELWKAQLYKASVKLQKSPSDRMRKLKSSGHLNNSASEEVALQPSIHQEGPAHNSPRIHNHLEAARTPQSAPRTPQSARSRTLDGERASSSYLNNFHLNNCSTGPVVTDSPRTISSHQPQLHSRPASLPSRVQASPIPSNRHMAQPDFARSQNRDFSMSPKTHYASGMNLSPSLENLPHKGVNTLIYNVHHEANVSHIPQPWEGQTSSVGLGITPLAEDKPQYDKDVAVFKQVEPTSQVSSSTDSGYSPHMCDHVLSAASPVLQQELHVRPSSSGHDSALLCSRESTPGHGPESGYTSPSQAEPNDVSKPACLASSPHKSQTFRVTLSRNPGLGFSISGGVGSPGNPFQPSDLGIFITKVQDDGPARHMLRRGDKLIEVNGVDFRHIEHTDAVNALRNSGQSVSLVVERH